MAAARAPDLVVLDLMLPRVDGLEVMRRIRALGGRRTPIILLTARGEESDRIIGLRLGADDYIVKPFSPAELVARVDAVLRRVDTVPEQQPPLRFDGLVVDPGGRRVLLDGEQVVAHPARVRPAAVPRPPPGPGVHAQPADGPRVGLLVLHRHLDGHRAHPAAARQARGDAGAPALDRDRVGRRLPLRGVRRLAGSLGFAIAAAGAVALVALVGYGRRRRAGHAEDPRAAGLRRRARRPRAGTRARAASAACAASSRSSPWWRWCSSRPRSCSSSTRCSSPATTRSSPCSPRRTPPR